MKQKIGILLVLAVIVVGLTGLSGIISDNDYSLIEFGNMSIRHLRNSTNMNISALDQNLNVPEFIQQEVTAEDTSYMIFQSTVKEYLTVTTLSNKNSDSILISLDKTKFSKSELLDKMSEFVLVVCGVVQTIDTRADMSEFLAMLDSDINKTTYRTPVTYHDYIYYYNNSDEICSIMITVAVKAVRI